MRGKYELGYKKAQRMYKTFKNIKAVKSDSLREKICDMHNFGKYAKCAVIAYLHKTSMPR